MTECYLSGSGWFDDAMMCTDIDGVNCDYILPYIVDI